MSEKPIVSTPVDPVRGARALVWILPLVLLLLIGGFSGLRAVISGQPFRLRFEPGLTASIGVSVIFLTGPVQACRDEGEFRTVRTLLVLALAATAAVPVGFWLLGRADVWDVGFFVAALFLLGLVSVLVSGQRWRGRRDEESSRGE